MNAEVVAVGTELLLGDVVDTNSAWIGARLAAAGIDSLLQLKVGDNQARIAGAVRAALDHADAVICCGGLGPTQDDITREAIAEVMGVPLVRDPALVRRVEEIFAARGRPMAANNLRQADLPRGATPIPQQRGTAPGLICPVGDQVVYAVPGVPHEMREMVERAVIPDLVARAGHPPPIVSRTLRTWGLGESQLAEVIAPRVAALDAERGGRPVPTIAFLASGVEGIKVRVTVKAEAAEAARLLDEEEAGLRALLGDAVFGVDGDTMEVAVGRLLAGRGLTLGVAESLTGGMIGSRITAVAGASGWFRGSVVSYASEVKYGVLGVDQGPVVSGRAARQMAEGARRVLGADAGLAVTGVAGPTESEGQPVGTVWVGLAPPGEPAEAVEAHAAGGRDQIRGWTTITALDLLRRRLLAG